MDLKIKNKISWQITIMHLLFGVLFVMAVVLYKERLFVDCGFYIFYTINDQFFRIENQRYVLAISQLLPLAEVYAGAGLKTILMTYSLCHVTFYYIIFLVLVYRFKDITAGLAILFLQTIGQLYLYFSPMLEICYGAALLVLFYVLLNRTDWSRWRWFWLILLEFMILTSHPENFIIFFFVVALHIIQNGYQRKLHNVFIFIFLGLMIAKFFTFSEYESNKIHYMMKQHENKLYQNFYSPDYVKGIANVLYSYFSELVVFFFITLYILIKKKQWKITSLFVFTVLGIIVLINVTNYANEFSRYRESLYNPLVPVIALAFLYLFYNHLSSNGKIISFLLLTLIIIHRMFQIYQYSKPFTQRVVQMENIIRHAAKKSGSKFLINLENCERKNWQLNWSYALESIMLSSLTETGKSVTIATEEDVQNIKAGLPLTNQSVMITRWDIRNDQSLNKKYFNCIDGPYIPLNSIDTTVNPEIYQGKINLMIPKKLSYKKNQTVYVPVSIVNRSSTPLYSGIKNSITLTYHWVEKESGSMMKGFSTPLEVDVSDEYRQVIEAETPGDKGNYVLLVDLLIHDKRLHIDAESEVEIH